MAKKKSRVFELFELFQSRPNFLILIHPDPDSIASALALKRLISRKAEKVVIAYDEASKRLQNQAMIRLLKIPMVNINKVRIEDFGLLGIVDGQWNHFPSLLNYQVDICIDHHPISVEHPYQFADIRPELGANSTILTEYLKEAKIPPSKRLATALSYGIKTDTSDFTRNIHSQDALAFSWLFPKVDYHLLKSIDQVEMSFRELEYFRLALDMLEKKRKTGYVHLGAVPSSDLLVMVADFLIRVRELEMVVVSGFEPEKLIIIFRNRNPRLDLGRLVKRGFEPPGIAGGHKYSARAEISLSALANLSRTLEHSPANEINRWIEKMLKNASKS